MMRSDDDQAIRVLEEAEQLKLRCQHEESIALLEGLLSRDPANVAALEELAENEMNLERFDRAEKAAKQAVALDSKSFIGQYVLGIVISARGEWEAAAEHLQEANKMQRNHPEILRCLGWALFRMGQRVQGVVTLERALNLDTDHPLTLCDLGVCYMEMHDFAKAQGLFLHAIEVDPSYERASECLLMVEQMRAMQEG